jgi:flagellar assembly protein FliH
MSSRIIRADRPNLKVSQTGNLISHRASEEHAMGVEKNAFEQGYSEGERVGKQMGEAMLESICKRYEKSLTDLATSHRNLVQQMEEQTVRLAIDIARKIVQRELTMDSDLVVALTAVALKRVSGHQSITVRVGRHDFEHVRTTLAAVNSAVIVKDDPELERGDFLIDTGQTHFDGRVSSEIDAIGRMLFDD